MLFKLPNRTLNSEAGGHTKKAWHHPNTCICLTLSEGTFVFFSIVRVPWLSGGTEAVFSGTSNWSSFLLFRNALSVPDGTYVPKGPSRPFWRLSLVFEECCSISVPWNASFHFLKLLNHPCQQWFIPRAHKIILSHKSLSIPLDQIGPRRNDHILWLCFLEKSLRQRDNIRLFSQAICSPISLHFQLKASWCWSFKKQGLSAWMALSDDSGGHAQVYIFSCNSIHIFHQNVTFINGCWWNNDDLC